MPLTAAEERELELLVELQDGGESLADYVRRVTPRWPPPAHVKPLRDLFEEALHRPVHALISLPPRHVKTETIKHGLAWFLGKAPASRNAYIGATGTFAKAKSKEIQAITRRGGVSIAGEWHEEELDGTAAHYWTTTRGGGLLAAGVGGQYIGHGTTGIQIFDDPYPTAKLAASETYRKAVWDYFEGVARNRVEPGGSQIICHHRWHPDDLIGKLLKEEGEESKGGKWRYINLPAVEGYSEEAFEAYRRGQGPIEAIGKPLWPEYYPLEELVPFMRNKHFWWALYMGSPRLRGQKLFEREVGRFDPKKFSITGCYAAIAVDPAATKKTSADHSAIVTGAMRGVGDEAVLYILDVLRLQVGIPELVRRLRAIQRRPTMLGKPIFSQPGRGLLVVVEAVAGFKSVPQTLLDMEPSLRVKEITPAQDKFLRAQPLSDAWNDIWRDPATGLDMSRVMIPDGAPWEAELLAEFDRFTGVDDDEDDQVDAVAHLWNALHKPGKKRPRVERRTFEPADV